ncbi:MAG TPA: DNA repair protein RadC [Candidatus Limnocylindria bacterium]|jgi:DNA repair protein RadC|nr:DNA repair protein RadC [Candidatus Limnocylindria bacterium]
MPRDRAPAERLAAVGAVSFTNDELLALVLAGPSALATARILLDAAGIDRLPGMLVAELVGYAGIGTRRAAAVVAAFELARRATSHWPEPGWRVRAPGDVAERLLPEMRHLEREELLVCLLNTRNVVLGRSTVYVGNLAGSSVRIGEVYREAVRRQAAAVIVAHNHPSGDPSPSADDLRITADLADAGRLLDIELLDHLVIGHDRWVSLRAAGAM